MKNTPPLGPAPARPLSGGPVEAAEPSRRRLLELLADRGEEPATVLDIAESLGTHQNTTRHHLRALSRAGLVEARESSPAGRRGRPSTGWLLTEAGRTAITGADSAMTEYIALVAAFAERLAERADDPGADARAVGRAWGVGLADGGVERAGSGERLVGLLDRLGFSPEPVGGGDEQREVLLRTCPLLDAARRLPEVVCQVHLGLAAGALAEYGADPAGLGLEPFAGPGVCRLVLPAPPPR